MEGDIDLNDPNRPMALISKSVCYAKVDGASIRIYDENTASLKQHDPNHPTLGSAYYIVVTSRYRMKAAMRQAGDLLEERFHDVFWADKFLQASTEFLSEADFRRRNRIPGEGSPGCLLECKSDHPREFARPMQYQIVQTGEWITPGVNPDDVLLIEADGRPAMARKNE